MFSSNFERQLLIDLIFMAFASLMLISGFIWIIYTVAVHWLRWSPSWRTRIACVGIGLSVTIPTGVSFVRWQDQASRERRAQIEQAQRAAYEAFTAKMERSYQLIDVKQESAPFTMVTLTFSVPRAGSYHLRLEGSVPTNDGSGYYYDGQVFNADRYHVPLTAGTHQISFLSQHPEQIPLGTRVNFFFIVEPHTPQEILINLPGASDAGSRRRVEGINFASPPPFDGCRVWELICSTDSRLHVTIQ